MRTLLISTLLAGCALTGVASADPLARHDGSTFGYRGGCGFDSRTDTFPGQLGGEDAWNGDVYVAVVPVDLATGRPSGAAVSATCEFQVNGVSQGVVLRASGTGLAVAAGRASFYGTLDDTIALCEHVTVGAETIVGCHDLVTTPVCPGQVCGEGGLLDQVDQILTQLGPVASPLDGVVCPLLVAAAPTVNAAPTFGLLSIDPVTGDTYVSGWSESGLFWDCPPYVTS